MITRVVKMTFNAEDVQKFEQIFEKTVEFIQSFEGCLDVRLMRNLGDANVYFTLSRWQSEEHLNIYRSSSLFVTTWADVKPLFSEKAQAWSLLDISPGS